MLNKNKVLEKVEELNKYNGYIPLLLHSYIDISYFDRISHKVELEYYHTRVALQGSSNPSEFLKEDLMKWIKQNPNYKEIIE